MKPSSSTMLNSIIDLIQQAKAEAPERAKAQRLELDKRTFARLRGHTTDGIIPKKKLSNSSLTTQELIELKVLRRFALPNMSQDSTNLLKIGPLPPQECSSISRELGEALMKGDWDLAFSTPTQTFEQL